MAINFPPECDTNAKRLAFCLRVHRRLIHRHRQARSQLPVDLTSEHRQQFKAWERTWYIPRAKRVAALVTEFRERAGVSDAQYLTRKIAADTDTTWDASIDVEQA